MHRAATASNCGLLRTPKLQLPTPLVAPQSITYASAQQAARQATTAPAQLVLPAQLVRKLTFTPLHTSNHCIFSTYFVWISPVGVLCNSWSLRRELLTMLGFAGKYSPSITSRGVEGCLSCDPGRFGATTGMTSPLCTGKCVNGMHSARLFLFMLCA